MRSDLMALLLTYLLAYCHGGFDGPTFSVAEHPVFYNSETLWVFIALTSSRFIAVWLC